MLYVIAAIPAVAHAITRQLPPYAPEWAADGNGEGDIVVVLSGDNPKGRARHTRHVLDVITPQCVLVSGGPWFVRMVVQAGVPRDRLVVDDTTFTTREQVAKLPAWSAQCGARRVVLIASALSMPRVAALVRASTIPVVLAASPLDGTPAPSGIRSALPAYAALRLSRDAFYEHMALAYYAERGWIR